MRTRTVTVSEGEPMGPIDWAHEMAADLPEAWREAEASPGDFTLNGRQVHAVCMYDGWPYWRPTPAVLHDGPLGTQWSFFRSYGVHPDSMRRKEPRP